MDDEIKKPAKEVVEGTEASSEEQARSSESLFDDSTTGTVRPSTKEFPGTTKLPGLSVAGDSPLTGTVEYAKNGARAGAASETVKYARNGDAFTGSTASAEQYSTLTKTKNDYGNTVSKTELKGPAGPIEPQPPSGTKTAYGTDVLSQGSKGVGFASPNVEQITTYSKKNDGANIEGTISRKTDDNSYGIGVAAQLSKGAAFEPKAVTSSRADQAVFSPGSPYGGKTGYGELRSEVYTSKYIDGNTSKINSWNVQEAQISRINSFGETAAEKAHAYGSFSYGDMSLKKGAGAAAENAVVADRVAFADKFNTLERGNTKYDSGVGPAVNSAERAVSTGFTGYPSDKYSSMERVDKASLAAALGQNGYAVSEGKKFGAADTGERYGSGFSPDKLTTTYGSEKYAFRDEAARVAASQPYLKDMVRDYNSPGSGGLRDLADSARNIGGSGDHYKEALKDNTAGGAVRDAAGLTQLAGRGQEGAKVQDGPVQPFRGNEVAAARANESVTARVDSTSDQRSGKKNETDEISWRPIHVAAAAQPQEKGAAENPVREVARSMARTIIESANEGQPQKLAWQPLPIQLKSEAIPLAKTEPIGRPGAESAKVADQAMVQLRSLGQELVSQAKQHPTEGRIETAASRTVAVAETGARSVRADAAQPVDTGLRAARPESVQTPAATQAGRADVLNTLEGAARGVRADVISNSNADGAVRNVRIDHSVIDQPGRVVRADVVGNTDGRNVRAEGIAAQDGASRGPRLVEPVPPGGKPQSPAEGADARGGRRVMNTGGELIVDGVHLEDGDDGSPETIKARRLSSDKRYITGIEIALAAMATGAAIAKMRDHDSDNADISDSGAGNADPDKRQVLHRRTYMIERGDTLQSIAERFFQDQSIAWLIAEMNVGAVRENQMDGKRIVEFKTRQLIELPEASDIEEWRNLGRAAGELSNLITIVTESAVDHELLATYLGTVSGQAPLNGVPAEQALRVPEQAHPGSRPFASLFSNAKSLPELLSRFNVNNGRRDNNEQTANS